MPVIIDTIQTRFTKSNNYSLNEEKGVNKKVKQLKKQQDRANRESKNNGGKTKNRIEAHRRFILEDENIKESIIDEKEETYVSNLNDKRVVLRRLKRKPGHRDGSSTTRF